MKVIVDGQWVDASEVSPLKHRFLGAFHPPEPPATPTEVLRCPCGANLWTREQTDHHWRLGHFDTNQYASYGTFQAFTLLQTERDKAEEDYKVAKQAWIDSETKRAALASKLRTLPRLLYYGLDVVETKGLDAILDLF